MLLLMCQAGNAAKFAGLQMQSAGSSGLSDFLSGNVPQGNSPSAGVPAGKTDLLGRALSSNKQDSFDFIGVSHPVQGI